MAERYKLEYTYYENLRAKRKKLENHRVYLPSDDLDKCKTTLNTLVEKYNSPFSYSIQDNNKIIENGLRGKVVDFYDIPDEFQEYVIETNMTEKNNPFVIITGDKMHNFKKVNDYKYFITDDNKFKPMKDFVSEKLNRENKEINPILQTIINIKTRL